MTINEYIEKYCTLEVRAKFITVTMDVPFVSPEILSSNESERFKIYTSGSNWYL